MSMICLLMRLLRPVSAHVAPMCILINNYWQHRHAMRPGPYLIL